MVEDQVLDRAYAALADPTRRRLLEALRAAMRGSPIWPRPLPMTFAGVSRHIGVLESAGLVQREVRGREHWVSLRPDGLTMAQQWINEQTDFWSTRADALAARLRRKGDDTMTEAPVVRVQRVMPAPPEVVFDQWLDPESLAEWMCPRPVRCIPVTVDPRVGGPSGSTSTTRAPWCSSPAASWSSSGRGCCGSRGATRTGRTRRVSVVNVAFEPLDGDQTLMSIEHSLLPPEEFNDFQNGWTLTSDQLTALLQGG